MTSPTAFAADVLAGLSRELKALPCKYLYDEEGSRLFGDIMDLPEYYLTRSEVEILREKGGEIAEIIGPEQANIIEFGAGDGRKTKVLIAHLLDVPADFTYFPIDICGNAVEKLASGLEEEFGHVRVVGIVSEYLNGLEKISRPDSGRNVVLFLGSSIGNFSPREIVTFLSNLHQRLCDGDLLLTGFDLRKDIDVLVRAYNDRAGVTQEFNFNMLRRINRELGGTFDTRKFRYYSIWDAAEGAVRSFLVSLCAQRVDIEALKMSFDFDAWEPIHTESSYKFSERQVFALAETTGFESAGAFFDSRGYFMDSLWRVKKT
jgi:L-histidine Nalpha-methyltransferase